MLKAKSETIGFFVLFGLVILVVAMLFWPFLMLLVFAVILAILFQPIYLKVLSWFKSPGLSSLLVVILIAIIIAGPILLIGQQVFYELADLFNILNKMNVQNLVTQYSSVVSRLPVPLQNLALSFNADFHSWLSQFASQIFVSLSAIISRLGWLFGSLGMVAITVFFLLRDGDNIKKNISDVLPLSETHEGILFKKISDSVNGVVKGQFIVALSEACVSFLGFSIFGVPKALLWASMLIIMSFVPTFGTALVLVPVVAYLFIAGHIGAGIGMAIWGWLSIVFIDNVMSAKIVSSKVRLYPVLTIFGVLGGLELFGVLGILLGPIIMAVFVSLVDIYRNDIKKLAE